MNQFKKFPSGVCKINQSILGSLMVCRAHMMREFCLPKHGDDRSSSFCMSGNEEEAGVYVVLSDLAEGFDDKLFLPGPGRNPGKDQGIFFKSKRSF